MSNQQTDQNLTWTYSPAANPLTDPNLTWTYVPADLYYEVTAEFNKDRDSIVDVAPTMKSLKGGAVVIFRDANPPYGVRYSRFVAKPYMEKLEAGDYDEVSFGPYVSHEPDTPCNNLIWVRGGTSTDLAMESLIEIWESFMLDGNESIPRLEGLIEEAARR